MAPLHPMVAHRMEQFMDTVCSKVFQLRGAPEFYRKIDEFRRAEPDIPPRAEAIRRLVEAGLAARGSLHQEVLSEFAPLGVTPEAPYRRGGK
jgi:hypothetical protein